MPSLVARSLALASAACLTASCLEGPFERTNVTDPRGIGRVALVGVPDSLHSRGASFTVDLVVEAGALPRRDSIVVFVEFDRAGATDRNVTVALSERSFASGADAGIVPQESEIAALIFYGSPGPVRAVTLASKTVVVWQRPRTAQLSCATVGCTALSGVGAAADIQVAMRDSLNFAVNVPLTGTPVGVFLSRNPAVADVVSRPTPATGRVVAAGIGTTWVVFSLGSATDSIQVTVSP